MTITEFRFTWITYHFTDLQLPESDGKFVKNFKNILKVLPTDSITPILQQLHPDARYLLVKTAASRRLTNWQKKQQKPQIVLCA